MACGVSSVHLGHSPDSTTSQSHVLVAVAPAVDCSLDQAALLSEVRVQLCQCPTDSIALGLVVKPIALVGILLAACARVNAVVRFEIRAEIFNVDRLDIASDRVFHLDSIPGVLECDPLNAVIVLSDYKGGRCRNGSRGWS